MSLRFTGVIGVVLCLSTSSVTAADDLRNGRDPVLERAYALIRDQQGHE